MATSDFISARDEPLPAPPLWIFPTMMIICILSILLPGGKARLICIIPLLKLLLSTLSRSQTTVLSYSHAQNCFMLLCRWIDFAILHDPERDFWAVNQSALEATKDARSGEVKAPSGTSAKLKWWAGLFCNLRGLGLNIQYKGTPSPVPKGYPKSRWIRDVLIRITWNYLLTDLATALLAKFATNRPFFEQALSLRSFFSFLHAIRFVTGFQWTYDFLAILCVSIGLSIPSDWPPIFGSLSECYTIGGVWGRFYHQLMRRNLLTAGTLVNKLFGIQRGTIASRYSQLFVGFGVSAFIHMMGAFVGSYEDNGVWQATFFFVQPLGIVVEESVMQIGKKLGIEKNGVTKTIGFVWAALWMLYTLRWMVVFMPAQWIIDDRPPSIAEFLFGLVEHKL